MASRKNVPVPAAGSATSSSRPQKIRMDAKVKDPTKNPVVATRRWIDSMAAASNRNPTTNPIQPSAKTSTGRKTHKTFSGMTPTLGKLAIKPRITKGMPAVITPLMRNLRSNRRTLGCAPKAASAKSATRPKMILMTSEAVLKGVPTAGPSTGGGGG